MNLDSEGMFYMDRDTCSTFKNKKVVILTPKWKEKNYS